MEIALDELDIEALEEYEPALAKEVKKRLPVYMTYPKDGQPVEAVYEWHFIGDAQHIDFRYKLDNFLHGWSLVGGSREKPVTFEWMLENKGKGVRAETKAVQPVDWLFPKLKVGEKVVFQPGQFPGAGVEAKGEMHIKARLQVVVGALKPYFKEYFLLGGPFKDWTRMVIRAVRVQKIEQETKKPTGKYETMWRAMIPIDQMPYCFLPSVRIWTLNGFKQASSLKAGDKIMGFSVQTVLDNTPLPYSGKVFTIKPAYLPSITVTENHPLLVREAKRKYGQKKHSFVSPPEWKMAKEIRPSTRYRWLMVGVPKIKEEKPFILDLNDFRKSYKGRHKVYPRLELNEELAYWFGWFVAEGSSVPEKGVIYLCLGKHERKLAKDLLSIVSKIGVKGKIRVLPSELRLEFYSRPFARFLVEAFGRKARNKKIPLWLLYERKSIIASFLKGLELGDGYGKGKRGFCQTSEELARMGQLLYLKIGLPVSFYKTVFKSSFRTKEVLYGLASENTLKFNKAWLEDDDFYWFPIRKVSSRFYKGKVYPVGCEEHILLTPYVSHNSISDRAMKKGWVPPYKSGVEASKADVKELVEKVKALPFIAPFPIEWTAKNWPEQLEKWVEWVKDKKPTPGTVALMEATYALMEHSYMGPVHIRATPRIDWHLLIDDGRVKVMDFRTDQANPLYFEPVAMTYEGRIDKKWMEFEGTLEPGELWNPNKELKSNVRLLASGTLDLEVEMVEDREKYTLKIPSGPLKGTYYLIQEEKDSPFYTWSSEASLQEKARFVFDQHTIGDKSHYDLRLVIEGADIVMEFSGMDKNLIDLGTEEPAIGILKPCLDLSWVDPSFTEGYRKVGGLKTYVKRLDQGTAVILNRGDRFWSMLLEGSKLKGYIVAKKANSHWEVEKGALPASLEAGNPYTGEYYRPFKITKRKGWNYYWVDIYDIRYFTRTEPDEMVRAYFPELDMPKGVELLIGLYPVKGTLHHARVVRVVVPDEISKEDIFKWIRQNKLHTWEAERIVQRKG